MVIWKFEMAWRMFFSLFSMTACFLMTNGYLMIAERDFSSTQN